MLARSALLFALNVTCFLFVRSRVAARLNAVHNPYAVFFCELLDACRRFLVCIALIVRFVDSGLPHLCCVGFSPCCAFIFRRCNAFLKEMIVLLCQPLLRVSAVHASF